MEIAVAAIFVRPAHGQTWLCRAPMALRAPHVGGHLEAFVATERRRVDICYI